MIVICLLTLRLRETWKMIFLLLLYLKSGNGYIHSRNNKYGFLNKSTNCTFVNVFSTDVHFALLFIWAALFKLVQVFLNKTQKCILPNNKCAFCTFVIVKVRPEITKHKTQKCTLHGRQGGPGSPISVSGGPGLESGVRRARVPGRSGGA